MALYPFKKIEWDIAWRYLRSKRQDGFVSVIAGFSLIGIMLGVATLIIVMAVMNGFRIQLVDRILGINGHVTVMEYGRDIDFYTEKSERLKQVSGVIRVQPMIEAQLMVTANGRNSGVVVRAVSADDFQNLKQVSGNVKFGDAISMQDGSSVAIGSRLAMKLGVAVGDGITLLSPKGHATPFGTAPRVKKYNVGAIYEMGMSLYDETFLFMDLKEAQHFMMKPNLVSAIDIFIKNPDDADDFVQPIQQAFGGTGHVNTWQRANDTFFAALAVERNVMFLILSLIILVAALNIISGMIMMVKDKGKDIAVLRTIGATRGAVMRVFFIAGAFIGVTGTILGLGIGVLFCTYIEQIRQGVSWLLGIPLFDPSVYFLAQMPAEMIASDVISIVVMALSLTFIATLYPSWRAAKMDPVEALRYE